MHTCASWTGDLREYAVERFLGIRLLREKNVNRTFSESSTIWISWLLLIFPRSKPKALLPGEAYLIQTRVSKLTQRQISTRPLDVKIDMVISISSTAH